MRRNIIHNLTLYSICLQNNLVKFCPVSQSINIWDRVEWNYMEEARGTFQRFNLKGTIWVL